MVSYGLLFYALLSAGGYLVVISLLLELLCRGLALTRGIPVEIVESSGWSWWVLNLFMELLFYVVIPTVAFAFFYFSLPLSGIRAGMAAALYSFTLGAAPVLMGLSARVKLPMSYVLFLLLSYLIKIAGTMAIIAWLYSL